MENFSIFQANTDVWLICLQFALMQKALAMVFRVIGNRVRIEIRFKKPKKPAGSQ